MSKLGWKVPFRQVYCATFGGWVKSTLWCHVVIRVFPGAYDMGPRGFADPHTKPTAEA